MLRAELCTIGSYEKLSLTSTRNVQTFHYSLLVNYYS